MEKNHVLKTKWFQELKKIKKNIISTNICLQFIIIFLFSCVCTNEWWTHELKHLVPQLFSAGTYCVHNWHKVQTDPKNRNKVNEFCLFLADSTGISWCVFHLPTSTPKKKRDEKIFFTDEWHDSFHLDF